LNKDTPQSCGVTRTFKIIDIIIIIINNVIVVIIVIISSTCENALLPFAGCRVAPAPSHFLISLPSVLLLITKTTICTFRELAPTCHRLSEQKMVLFSLCGSQSAPS
jgi:hypothetical protein